MKYLTIIKLLFIIFIFIFTEQNKFYNYSMFSANFQTNKLLFLILYDFSH